MFELENLHVYYGKGHVVQGISLKVNDGEAVGLVGRNGAGKTTTLKATAGLLKQASGRVLLDGHDVSSKAAHLRARLGFGYVPEERAVFPDMTVEENIRIGSMLLGRSEQTHCLDTAYELFPILRDRRGQTAGTLSGGQQKMLALARGISLSRRFILVDEPSEGLMPINVDLVASALVQAVSEGLGVLVVDASFDLLRTVCQRLYVMDNGTLIGNYTPNDFSSPDELAATYLSAGT
jgi:branched-chain amino acid transport system ATP-binding protein